jgi:metal-responsive CopG/Arc/MetJ family transcriptional regulator
MAGFKIPSIPPTTNKTIRFPNDLVAEVENLIKNRDCTFSAFIIAAVRAAVEEVRYEDDTPKGL